MPSPTSDGLTGTSGRFAGVVPASGGDIQIQAWTTEATPRLIACEQVSVEAATVTVATLGPTRNDYGTGHPCGPRT